MSTWRRGIRLRKALFPVFSECILMDLFIMVFFPISTTESPRRPFLIFCSWFDPTLSAATIRIWLYSSRSWHSFASYAIFFSAFDCLIAIDADQQTELLLIITTTNRNRGKVAKRGPRLSGRLCQGGQRGVAVTLTSTSEM